VRRGVAMGGGARRGGGARGWDGVTGVLGGVMVRIFYVYIFADMIYLVEVCIIRKIIHAMQSDPIPKWRN